MSESFLSSYELRVANERVGAGRGSGGEWEKVEGGRGGGGGTRRCREKGEVGVKRDGRARRPEA